MDEMATNWKGKERRHDIQPDDNHYNDIKSNDTHYNDI